MAEKLRQLQVKNSLLSDAIMVLHDRQQILEEFIDTHHPTEDFALFLKNRERMMFALEYSSEDFDIYNGKRSPKSFNLVQLLRVARRYQLPVGKRLQMPIRKKREAYPVELESMRIFIDLNTGLIQRRPPKRCERCYDPGHERRNCPYKLAASRTPEVVVMIKERIAKIKEMEVNDPFISAKYKIRHFKVDPNRKEKLERRKMNRERRQAEMEIDVDDMASDGSAPPESAKLQLQQHSQDEGESSFFYDDDPVDNFSFQSNTNHLTDVATTEDARESESTSKYTGVSKSVRERLRAKRSTERKRQNGTLCTVKKFTCEECRKGFYSERARYDHVLNLVKRGTHQSKLLDKINLTFRYD